MNDRDLHFSYVVSISEKDAVKITELLVNAIETSKEIVTQSDDEELFFFGLDFFRV